MEHLLIPGLIVLFASVLQTSTGFGFSIMATPFLLPVYDPREAIQLNLILSLLISVAMLPRIVGEIDRELFGRLFKGGLVGSVIGIAIFPVGGRGAAQAGHQRPDSGPDRAAATATPRCAYTSQGPLGGFAVGCILTTSMGMPGPPLLLYFAGTSMDKTLVRSTTLAFFLFIYLLSLIMQVTLSSSSKEVWITALALSPVAAMGVVLGQKVFRFINQEVFRIITYLILSITGIYLFISSI